MIDLLHTCVIGEVIDTHISIIFLCMGVSEQAIEKIDHFEFSHVERPVAYRKEVYPC